MGLPLLSVLIGVVHADPLGVLIAFGAGMLSFVSPCVLPLVPAYVGLLAGVRGGDVSEGQESFGRLLRSAALFVVGFTVVFVALGAAASSVGSTLAVHKRGLEIVAGALTLAVGALFVSGASPALLSVERRFHVSPSELGVWAPPVMGAAFAFGWTPCIGPVLGAVMAQAAARATLAGGVLLLVFYSLGLGVPFVLAGLATGAATAGRSNRGEAALSWVRRRYRAIAVVAGLLLVAWGVAMVAGEVTRLSSWFSTVLADLHLSRLTRI